MAVEWRKIALADDVKRRTLQFQLHGAASEGLVDVGIGVLRGGWDLRQGTDEYLPQINWSATPDTGADAECVKDWDNGVDADGETSTAAHFILSGTYADQLSPNLDNHLLEGVWGCVMAVPPGVDTEAVHEFDISGLVANDYSTDSSENIIHFSLWRAYVDNNTNLGSDPLEQGFIAGLKFRLVNKSLVAGSADINVPYPAHSMKHFVADRVTVNLDKSKCVEGIMCYYLISAWVGPPTSTDANSLPSNAEDWPSITSGEQCSMKLQVEATYTPI